MLPRAIQGKEGSVGMPAKRRARFGGWDRVTIRDDAGCEREAIAPVIVSASRSTDIPAFYGDWFVRRLEAGHAAWVNPWNGRVTYVSFAKTRAIVFWSKNPRPIVRHLPRLDAAGYSYSFLYTLNDYRQENLEQNLPPLAERERTFIDLSSRLGPWRVSWRYDPLLLSDSLSVDDLLSRIEAIGSRLHRYTRRLIISFVDIARYPRVRSRLAAIGHPGVREFTEAEIDAFCSGLRDIAAGWDLEVSACGERRDLSGYGIRPGHCISAGLMRAVFPGDEPLLSFLAPSPGAGGVTADDFLRDPGQRKECGCIVSKDIGRYSTCMHLCAYCYANTTETTVMRNWTRHRRMMESGIVPESIAGTGEEI